MAAEGKDEGKMGELEGDVPLIKASTLRNEDTGEETTPKAEGEEGHGNPGVNGSEHAEGPEAQPDRPEDSAAGAAADGEVEKVGEEGGGADGAEDADADIEGVEHVDDEVDNEADGDADMNDQYHHGEDHDEDPEGEEELFYGQSKSAHDRHLVGREQAEDAVAQDDTDPEYAALFDGARKAFADLKDKHASLAECIVSWMEIERVLDARSDQLARHKAKVVELEKFLQERSKKLDERESSVAAVEVESLQRVQAQKDAAFAVIEERQKKFYTEKKRFYAEMYDKKKARERELVKEKEAPAAKKIPGKVEVKPKGAQAVKGPKAAAPAITVKAAASADPGKSGSKPEAKSVKADEPPVASVSEQSKETPTTGEAAKEETGEAQASPIKEEKKSADNAEAPKPAEVPKPAEGLGKEGDVEVLDEMDEQGEEDEEQMQVEAAVEPEDEDDLGEEGDGEAAKEGGDEAAEKGAAKVPAKELQEACEAMDGEGLKRYIVHNTRDVRRLTKEVGAALGSALDAPKLVLRAVETYRPAYPSASGRRTELLSPMRLRHARASLVLLEVLEDILLEEAKKAGRPKPVVAASLQKQAKAVVEGWMGVGKEPGKGLNPDTASSFDIWVMLRTAAVFQAGSLLPVPEMIRFAAVVARRSGAIDLIKALGLEGHLREIIRKVISNGEIVDAVLLAHDGGILGEFKPEELLRKHLRDMRGILDGLRRAKPGPEGERVANERELASLKTMIHCIEHCELEKVYPTDGLKKSLQRLEEILPPDNRAASGRPSQLTVSPGIRKRPRYPEADVDIRKRPVWSPSETFVPRKSFSARVAPVTPSSLRSVGAYARESAYEARGYRGAKDSSFGRVVGDRYGDRYGERRERDRIEHVRGRERESERERERERSRNEQVAGGGLSSALGPYATSAAHMVVQDPLGVSAVGSQYTASQYAGSGLVYSGNTSTMYSTGLDVGYASVGTGTVSYAPSGSVAYISGGRQGVVVQGTSDVYGSTGTGLRDRYSVDLGQPYTSSYGR